MLKKLGLALRWPAASVVGRQLPQQYKSVHRSFSSSLYDTQDFLTAFHARDSKDEKGLLGAFEVGRSSGVLTEDNFKTLRDVLSNMRGGTLCAMKLRTAAIVAKDKQLNNSMKMYLEACFAIDTLEFRRVTFEDSTGVMLERVAEKDSVLARIRTLRELKKRLGDGRRCYALLHPQLPDDPVAFIHVALTQDLANSLPYLDEHCREHPQPTHAMFYSVNSPHAALGGLDLAMRIIKLAAADVAQVYPSVHTFSTLSPIPGFMTWLHKVAQGPTHVVLPAEIVSKLAIIAAESSEAGTVQAVFAGQELAFLVKLLADETWVQDEKLSSSLRPVLEHLGRQYLASEKAKEAPLDPVARFHTRNGASLHRLNWLGNPSQGGLHKSAGLMVNYMYDLSKLKERALAFPNVHVNSDF